MLRFAACHLRLSRLWLGSHPVDGRWEDLLLRVSGEIGLSRSVELRIASGSVMPLTWGTLAPKVLLPAEAHAWPPERRRLVLLHELAHVARRDSLARTAASLACTLYWFHPGVWFAARQMRLEQEHAADDQVLAAGAPARTYALSLLHLARRVERIAFSHHGAAMAEISQLERRVISITTPVRRERPGLVFRCSAMAIASFVTLAAAVGVPAKPSVEAPAPLPGKQAEVRLPEPQAAPETPPRVLASSPSRVEEALREASDDSEDAAEVVSTPAVPTPALPSADQVDEAQPRPVELALDQEDVVDRPEVAQSRPVYGPQLPRPEPARTSREPAPGLTRPREPSSLWSRRGPRTAAKILSVVLSVAASASEQPGDLPR